jgi:hypothetical protein
LGIELFERAADSRGRIPKAERRVPAGAEDDLDIGIAFLLTFDVGRILVGFDPVKRLLDISQIEDEAAAPGGLEDLAEADPWWRLFGSAICGVWPLADGAGAASSGREAPTGVCLQFREDAENPRWVTLKATPAGVGVGVNEGPNGS